MLLGSFTALICIAYTLIALLLAYVTEDMVLESMLTQEAKIITSHYSDNGSLPRPGLGFMQLHATMDTLPRAVKQAIKESQASGKKKLEIFGEDGKHYHALRLNLASTSRPAQDVYLLAEVTPFLVVRHLSARVWRLMLTVAILMFAAALGLAYMLARRIALPLQALANEVSTSPANDTPHFTASQRGDEIGFLARKLEDSLHARQAALLRETNFTRDLSHELRTPITILNNLLLAAQWCTCNEEDRQVAQQSVDELMSTIDILLALARAENMQASTVDMMDCIEKSLLLVHHSATTKSHEVSLDLPAQWQVSGNEHLIGLLLNNLFSNAMTHGGEQSPIHVFCTGQKLILSNAIKAEGHPSPAGFGHGRKLMERIAIALHWEIRFEQSADKFQVEIIPQSHVLTQNM